jgi:hypothetical protein
MKIEFTPKRVKLARVAIALVAISLAGYVAYAATQIQVNNAVTINAANNIGVSITTINPTTCPASGNAAYQTVSPFTNPNPWAINAGSSSQQFFCLENTGTGTDTAPSVTMGTITGVTCTTAPCLTLTTTPATIPPIAPGAVSAPIAVTVSSDASSAGTGSFSLTVK